MTARPNWQRLPTTAITAEEHRALERRRGRPITDEPIGHWTAARRDTDAAASAVHADPSTERTEQLHRIVKTRTRKETK